jgi:hypothetical protein
MCDGFCHLFDWFQEEPFPMLRSFPLQKGEPMKGPPLFHAAPNSAARPTVIFAPIYPPTYYCPRSSDKRCSPCRSANATIVNVGLAAADVGKTLPSAIIRLGTSWVIPHSFTTPAPGSALIRVVPML